MANIESIKQKILQLDAGVFQNLCDSYLYKIGYPKYSISWRRGGYTKDHFGYTGYLFYCVKWEVCFCRIHNSKNKVICKN